MRHFNITYTSYFNRQHKRVGHLYQGRYKSILVEKEAYLGIVSRYIHLNPIRSKSLQHLSVGEKFKTLSQYPWSSLPGYLDKEKQQAMLDYSLVLADFGGQSTKGLSRYRKQILLNIEDGLDLAALVKGKGDLRRVTMDLLYRFGGLKGPAIGGLFGIDYSAVSQERKRLRERLVSDLKLAELMQKLERQLSIIKI